MIKSKQINMKKGFWKIWIGVGLFLILAILIFVLILNLKGPTKKCGNGICEIGENNSNCPQDCKIISHCGNGICETGEGCYNCPEDCKCGLGEYCSEKNNSCVKPVCGNGICEIYENPDNCCLDCPCTIPGEFCSNETYKCEMPNIS